MTGVSRTTIDKLLCDLDRACSDYQDKTFRNLKSRRVQCDGIWSFIGAKEKNCTVEMKKKGAGDVWTWVALDPDTKLVPCWFIGYRDAGCAYRFMHDLAERLAHRVQLTTDGHRAYLSAVEDAFGSNIDYAMLQKIYDNSEQGPETRYSPAICMGARKAVISGNPDHNHVSTSHVERQNLTMRVHAPVYSPERTDTQKNWKITSTRSRFTTCIRTSPASTNRSASRPRWNRASAITFGLLRKSSTYCKTIKSHEPLRWTRSPNAFESD
jgi:IS1 family transposase